MTDAISDMIARIKNGYMARLGRVEIPWSRMKESLAKLLVETGYLADAKKEKGNLVLTLKYNGKEPVMTEIQRISRPSLRVYAGHNNMQKVLGGMGTLVVSTPKGLMTGKKAHKEGIGGEVICKVY